MIHEKQRQNDRGLCAGSTYADGQGGTLCSRKKIKEASDGYKYCWQHFPKHKFMDSSKVSFCRCSGAGCDRCKGYGWRRG
jgi:hypothetical protein